MSLLGKQKYIVENNVVLCQQKYESLVLLYQPLIGAHAVALYLFMNIYNLHTDYSQICLLTQMSIEEVERSLIKLEQYQLIDSYKHQEDDSMLHKLKEPLFPNEFLKHYVFGLELRHALGNYRYNSLVEKYRKVAVNKDSYLKITEKYQAQNLDLIEEEQIKEVIEKNKESDELPANFNYDDFLMNVTDLQFPQELRTKKNLMIIAELALLYGISEKRMRTLVFRSIDYQKRELKINDLINRVRYEEVKVDEALDIYQLPPIAFLQRLQNGAAVTKPDKRLIEQLADEMKLNHEVINRLIEHLMLSNNNVLVPNYALKVAATWKAFDVKTVEEANQIIKQTSQGQSKDKQIGPAKPVKRREKEVKESGKKLPEDKKEAILKRIKKMGEQHEES